MEIKDHDLRQLNEERLQALQAKDPAALLRLAIQLLHDLKEARERLNQNPSNSSRPPSSQAPWFRDGEEESTEDDEEGEEDASSDRQPKESGSASSNKGDSVDNEQPEKKTGKGRPPEPKNKPGKQPGAQGFGRPKELVVNETIHHYPDQCAICFDPLNPELAVAHNGFYTTELILGGPEKPGLTLWVTKHIYYTIACACHHETHEMPYRAPEDEGEWKGVELTEWRLAGPGLCAYITWLHFRMRLPVRKIREFLQESFGLSLSTGAIQKCIMETARACDPIFLLILSCLLDESLMHADETPHKEAGTPFWLWTFVTASTVLFLIGRRTKEVWNTIDLLYAGWLMSDGYNVYRDHKKRLRCWAHLIRKAKGLADTLTPWIQGYGVQILEIMNTLMDGIYAAREGPGGSIKAKFQDELDRLKTLCKKMGRSRHKKAGELRREFLNDWDAIFRVLDHPELPMTNNAAEQMLRHWVILRRISQGTRSKQGSRALVLIASVIETCRQRKASPLRYLTAVIERNHTVPDWYGLGISLENQMLINRHVPQLLKVPGFRIAVIEPILGDIDISPYIDKLDWVIVGSETGEGCPRPANPDWFRKLRDVTKTAGKPFFIKQLGTSHKSPERELDGRTWEEFPEGYIKKVKGVKVQFTTPPGRQVAGKLEELFSF